MTCLPSFCAGSCFVWGEWKKRHRKMNTVFVFCLFLLVATALAKGMLTINAQRLYLNLQNKKC